MNHDDASRSNNERVGLLFFLAGVFPLVLVLMSIWRPPSPGVELTGLSAVAQAIVRGFGLVPPLILSGGMAVLGIAMFLGFQLRDPGRHLLGIVGVSLALAIIFGAIQTGMGGRLGDRLGGRLAGMLGIGVGIALGAGLLLATVGLVWLRDRLPIFEFRRKEATLGSALTETDYDGVSSAEASMLVPDESTLAYMEDLWRHTSGQPSQAVPIPPSPYPTDVRLQGEIPPGAKPLNTVTDEPIETQAPDSSSEALDQSGGWQRSAAKRAAEDPVGGTVASGESLDVDDSAPSVQPIRDFRGSPGLTAGINIPTTTRDQAQDPFRDLSSEDLNFQEGEETAEESAPAPGPAVPLADALIDPSEAGQNGPPPPTWEQDSLFEKPEAAQVEAELDLLEEEQALEQALDEDEEQDEEIESEAEEPEESGELEEDEEYEYEEDEEESEEDEEAAELEEGEAEAAELEDDEDEEEEDEEYDYVYVDEDGNEVAAEDLEEDEEEEELEEEGEVVAEEEAEAEEEEDEEEDEEGLADEESPEESEPDALEVAAEEEGMEYEEVVDLEPEVVLKPKPKPKSKTRGKANKAAKAASKSAPAETPPESSPLVQACGRLFLEEGRVAVSLLQRRHGLAFDEACEVLDQLQKAGLIGPYQGGKRREILLSQEEWEERAPASPANS